MSFWSSLFGKGTKADDNDEPTDVIHHAGFSITPTPIKEDGQFRVSGKITKEIDGTVKTHTFIRADLCTSKAEAIETTILKAKRIIDEQGESIFQE